GKATLIAKLFDEFPERMAIPVSHTSRAPQEEEKDGVQFWLSDRERMERQAKDGFFLEIVEVDGDLYGTSVDAVNMIRNAGKVAVIHLDLAGVQQLKSSGYKCKIVWITPPSLQVLSDRLKASGVEETEI
ncbi:hypothetical protein GUITHDRAFT_57789, partial [Guillardia theta CCMP2712]